MQPPRLQYRVLGVCGHGSTQPMSSFQPQHGQATHKCPLAPQICTARSPRSAPPPREELPKFSGGAPELHGLSPGASHCCSRALAEQAAVALQPPEA